MQQEYSPPPPPNTSLSSLLVGCEVKSITYAYARANMKNSNKPTINLAWPTSYLLQGVRPKRGSTSLLEGAATLPGMLRARSDGCREGTNKFSGGDNALTICKCMTPNEWPPLPLRALWFCLTSGLSYGR